MRYYDPYGYPMSREDWARAFCDPANDSICETKKNGLLIRTCWVGIAPDHERIARIFMVEVKETTRIGQEMKTRHEREPTWHPTREDALREHQRLEHELLGVK